MSKSWFNSFIEKLAIIIEKPPYLIFVFISSVFIVVSLITKYFFDKIWVFFLYSIGGTILRYAERDFLGVTRPFPKLNLFVKIIYHYLNFLLFYSLFCGLKFFNLNIKFIVIFSLIYFLLMIPPCVYIRYKRENNKRAENTQIVDHSPLIIIHATYGSKNNSIDVTDRLNNLLENGALNTRVSNDLSGDPDRGQKKFLRIKYMHNRKVISQKFKENKNVSLP